MSKLARQSCAEPYECRLGWPEDCFVQCGSYGVVGTKEGAYTTAFFEAFPKEPDCFVRGEAETIEGAEIHAFEQFQRHAACPGHEFESRGYENGGGFCKHCNMFASKVIDPIHPCRFCGVKTWYTSDNKRRFVCEHCYDQIPLEDLDRSQVEIRAWKTAKASGGEKDFESVLTALLGEWKRCTGRKQEAASEKPNP